MRYSRNAPKFQENTAEQLQKNHCVTSVHIRSFSGPSTFSRIRTEYYTERYGVSLCIQSEYGKIRTRKTPNRDTFHAVNYFSITYQWNSFPCRTTALNIPSNTKPPKQNIKYQYWLFCSCSTKSHMQNIPCKKKSERGNKALTMRIKSDFFCVISFYFCNHVGVSKWL